MLLVGMWPLVGALTDANAHINDPQLETFFTPWHALLYSGVLAVGLCIGYVAWRNHQRGYAWTRAVPPGYGLTLVGVGVLGVAGIGDLIWHSLYGIERDIPAITSPTHMLIILGILLVVAGPLRSAYTRPAAEVRGLAQLPMILSVLLMYTMITLPLQYLHPFSYRFAQFGNVDLFANKPYPVVDSYLAEGLGLASILVTTAVLMGIVLFLVRRWQLLFGALTLILTVEYRRARRAPTRLLARPRRVRHGAARRPADPYVAPLARAPEPLPTFRVPAARDPLHGVLCDALPDQPGRLDHPPVGRLDLRGGLGRLGDELPRRAATRVRRACQPDRTEPGIKGRRWS